MGITLPPVGNESDIESVFKRELTSIGGDIRKLVTPQRKASFDRLCIFNYGILFFVEIKKPGETLRPDQERERIRLLRKGHNVAVVSTREEVLEFKQGVKDELESRSNELRRLGTITLKP